MTAAGTGWLQVIQEIMFLGEGGIQDSGYRVQGARCRMQGSV